MSYKNQRIEKLQNDFQRFSDKYSTSPQPSYVGNITEHIKFILNNIIKSKNRIGIIFGCIFLIVFFMLYTKQPKFILKKGKTFIEQDTLSYTLLIKYTFLFSVILLVLLIGSTVKIPMVQKIVFGKNCTEYTCSV